MRGIHPYVLLFWQGLSAGETKGVIRTAEELRDWLTRWLTSTGLRTAIPIK